MSFGKQPHILNAASNLLGICFILITGLKLTQASVNTFADEISCIAAVCLMASCVLSYISIRRDKSRDRLETLADYAFLAGLFSLFTAMVIFTTGIL